MRKELRSQPSRAQERPLRRSEPDGSQLQAHLLTTSPVLLDSVSRRGDPPGGDGQTPLPTVVTVVFGRLDEVTPTAVRSALIWSVRPSSEKDDPCVTTLPAPATEGFEHITVHLKTKGGFTFEAVFKARFRLNETVGGESDCLAPPRPLVGP